MSYTQDEKSTGLDVLTTLDAGDLAIIGDVSDAGRAKAITATNFGTTIAQYINITNIATGILDPAHGGTGIDSSTAVKGDLIVGSGAGTFSLQNVGTNGQVLTADSAFPNGVKWGFVTGGGGSGGGGTKIAIDTTQVAVLGSQTNSVIYTVVIPGGTLGTNNGIKFSIPYSLIDSDGNATFTILYGGSLIGTISSPSNSGDLIGYMEGTILANAATNSQKGSVYFIRTDNTIFEDNSGTASVDSTINQNLVIRVTTDSGAKATAESITVEGITSAGEVTTMLPIPQTSGISGSNNKIINSNTTGEIGMFRLENKITINDFSFSVQTVTVGGTVKIGIYSEDGLSKLLDKTTGAISGTGAFTETLSSPLTLAAGNYYFVVLPVGTTNVALTFYTAIATLSADLAALTGKTVMNGTITTTASTLPTTVDPINDITYVDNTHGFLGIRLDN